MKRTLSLLLALIIVLSVPVSASASSNHTGASSWAIDSIVESENLGLIPKKLYPLRYKESITREEFSSLIVKVYEKVTETPIQERATFRDTNDDYVGKVAGLGIVTGVGDNQFNPDASLTREQAATIINRLLVALNHPYTDIQVERYADTEEISEWSRASVNQLKAEGILTGVEDNKFVPKGTYTLEQAIVTVYRTLTHYTAKTVESVLSGEHIKTQMMSLKAEYPTGLPWTNDNYYGWKGGIFSGGYGCAGFAFMLSDEAFGGLPARKHTDFNNIRLGDIVRVNNDTHSVIVIDITGDEYTLAEGNYNSSVNWGRKFTLSQFKSIGTYVMTRYPEK